MKRFTASLSAALLALALCGTTATAEDGAERVAAGLSFRYRYEHVDDDGFDRNANASTVRSGSGQRPRSGTASARSPRWKTCAR